MFHTPRHRSLFCLAVALILVLFVRHRLVEGWLVPIRVSGSSMAPWLLGEHHRFDCGACAFQIVVSPSVPRAAFVRCPNCGSDSNQFPTTAPRQGDPVRIDKWPLLFRDPRRWEVVAFEDPEHRDRWAIKRVVGLPGETVEIVAGDVRINGHFITRPLWLQRQMSWPVSDDRFRPSLVGGKTSRWHPEQGDSEWRMWGDAFRCDRAAYSADQPDWLTYQHVAKVTGTLGLPEEGPVLDDAVFNQATGRALHAVSDLSLSGQCQLAGEGAFFVRQDTGQQLLFWYFDLSCRTVSLRSGQDVLGSTRLTKDRFRFRVATCDGEAALWIDDRLVLSLQCLPSQLAPVGSSSRPFALGAAGLQATVRALVIERDTYYTLDTPRPAAGPWKLDAAEFFVLGDNSPVSADCRQWPEPIQRTDLRGIIQRQR